MAAVQAVPEPEQEPGNKLDQLTAAETGDAEQAAGQGITTLGNDAYPQTRLLGALAWVYERRSNPKLKYDDYMRTHKPSEVIRDLGLTGGDEGGKADT